MGGKGGWLAWRQACRLAGWLAGCGGADLRVNKGHEHVDLHVFQGSQDVQRAGWLVGWGWLAGCGDTDLRVNRAHGHIDLHVFRGPQTYREGWGHRFTCKQSAWVPRFTRN